ncbi:hypothetical protein [uncultured Planktosalinus sp.]|uniref:hypothetical protein n=1 Tax=uncultured Planktosalinus sp. TaxID=1810935 RepID=UPI0030DBB4FA
MQRPGGIIIHLDTTTQNDEHYFNYPSFSPYAYTFHNPIIYTDPDGRDPIYGKNFWGRVRIIGDDGKDAGKSYLVRGATKRSVNQATKAGEKFSGSLAESDNVFHIPTGNILEDVKTSVDNTIRSGDSADTRVEHGAHTMKGDENARHWDPGKPKRTEISFDKDGNKIETSTWSVQPFLINGKTQPGGNGDDIGFIWHTHPNGSTPSPDDKRSLSNWRSNGFKGNTFLIDVNNEKVNFFNEKGTLMKVNYSDFLKMGNKEKID